MPYADLTGVRLFYTDEEEGHTAVLLVHGWGCDSHDWSWQVGPLVDAGFRVIAPDSRGHGRSSVPCEGFDPTDFAADLAELIGLLQVGRVVAVGHSQGGVIVSTLAVERPELVAAAVVVDSPYGLPDHEASGRWQPLLDALGTDNGLERVADALAAVEGERIPDALRNWHRRRVLGMAPAVMRSTLEAFLKEGSVATRSGADEYLRRRRCPVLTVHTHPAQAAWEESTFADPRSRSLSWPEAGHWLHQERADDFNDLVLRWLAGLQAN
ncbi:alpha/beta fold hydrolase [Streptomyces sp. FH025]|uniref:alpha/beta fold hydrolase n=1 Tax=Streptomyces sp. FH025 TaxID=2815937 RepID=UPI001A9D5317|nr:alpha/beta hydrolase [Streptomyces sp. FH025]MBO1414731.1 alpha/beta hydrolase [Streptomyces sp. FH025]